MENPWCGVVTPGLQACTVYQSSGRERQKRRRARLSEEQKVIEREKGRERQKLKRAGQSEEAKEMIREKARERQSQKRAGQSEEEKKQTRERARERQRQRRAEQSEEEKGTIREKGRERQRQRRAGQSEEEKEQTRERGRERQRQRRAGQSEEEKERIRERAREQKRCHRANKAQARNNHNTCEAELASKGKVTTSGTYMPPKSQHQGSSKVKGLQPQQVSSLGIFVPPSSAGESEAERAYPRKRKLDQDEEPYKTKFPRPSSPEMLAPGEIFFKADHNTKLAREQLGRPVLLQAARSPSKLIKYQ